MSVVAEAPPFPVGRKDQGFTRRDPRPITEIARSSSPKDWEVLAAYQNYGEPKLPSRYWGIFNAVKIPAPEISVDASVIVARAVYIPNIKEGEPDRNSLHVCLTDSNGRFQRLPDLALPVDKRMVNWEDARVGPNDRTLGFTVIIQEDGKYIPRPAIVDVGIADGNLRVVGDPKIFGKLTGKNVVPLEDGLIYRPEGETHKLHYPDSQGKLPKTIDFSNFRHIPWLSKKMGIVAKPIESEHLGLEDGEKLLLIIGQQGNQIGIDGKLKDDVYSLGLALLDKDWHPFSVDPVPLLERKHFLGNLDPSMDLNPKKEVVYATYVEVGVIGLIVFTNVGDKITVPKRVPYAVIRPRITNMRLLRVV